MVRAFRAFVQNMHTCTKKLYSDCQVAWNWTSLKQNRKSLITTVVVRGLKWSSRWCWPTPSVKAQFQGSSTLCPFRRWLAKCSTGWASPQWSVFAHSTRRRERTIWQLRAALLVASGSVGAVARNVAGLLALSQAGAQTRADNVCGWDEKLRVPSGRVLRLQHNRAPHVYTLATFRCKSNQQALTVTCVYSGCAGTYPVYL